VLFICAGVDIIYLYSLFLILSRATRGSVTLQNFASQKAYLASTPETPNDHILDQQKRRETETAEMKAIRHPHYQTPTSSRHSVGDPGC
jgi:hypothetical protein